MTRHQRRPRHGEGTAWLVADRSRGDVTCYWYVGGADDRVGERTRTATAEAAVAWGRARTARVRIRTVDGRTQWAGTAPRPEGFSETWIPRVASDAGRLPTRPRHGADADDAMGRASVSP